MAGGLTAVVAGVACYATAGAADAETMAAPGGGSLAEIDLEALASADLVVTTTPACPYCKKAKGALKDAGIPYAEVYVDQDQQLRAKLKEVVGRSSVPQVFVGGASVGGSDDLAAALQSGDFQKKLEEARVNGTRALPQDLMQCIREAAGRVKAASQASGASASAAMAAPKELLDLASRAAAPAQKGGLPRRKQQVGPRTLPVFSGKDLLEWLQGQQQQQPEAQAQALLQAVLITPAVPFDAAQSAKAPSPMPFKASELYSLVEEVPPPAKGQPLNSHIWWTGPARPAVQVAEELRALILRLYDAHLSADGKSVNYRAMKVSPLFKQYTKATSELQRVDLSPLSRQELLAFGINLYNALIVHATVVVGAPTSTLERADFFSKSAAYVIGGHTYASDDIENGILRCNRPAASNLFVLVGLPGLASGQFKNSDARSKKLVCPPDPRIHFALVCGARSCPPIKMYTPDNVEEALQGAGEAFCAGEVEVDRQNQAVKLSKIFQWYSVDFGKNDTEKLRFISKFLQGSAKQDLEAMLASGKKIKVSYKPYDWSLNGEA